MNKKGFSLTEVAVASVIFAFSITGILASVAKMRVPAEISNKKLRSAQLSKQVLEELRSVPTTAPAFVDGTYSGLVKAEYPGYTYDYTVTTDAVTGVKKVVVTVHTP